MDAFAEVSNGVFIWCFIHRAPLVLMEVVVVQCVCVHKVLQWLCDFASIQFWLVFALVHCPQY